MTRLAVLTPHSTRLILLAMWATACAILIYITWDFIVPMNFRDPDDALRLVQVRDLLAGQSWFDLTQYRIFPPAGVPMHWSRLVDLPIALMLAATEPLLGAPLAERLTLITIPLLLLLILCVLVYKIARTMALGRRTALLSVLLLLSSLPILVQLAPLRIDHHGMQVVFGAVAALALLRTDRLDGRRDSRRDSRLGLTAGVAMACWMQISIEGLPYAVMAGAILALPHVWRTDRWADLRGYMIALPAVSAVLLFGTHYPADALLPWCDSLSPSYLVPLATTSIVLMGAHLLLPGQTRAARLLPLALAGGAGMIAFLALSRQCLAGPFDTLDPIVYKLWYLGVLEGLPITAQRPDLQAMIVAPSLLGLLGSALALRRAGDDGARARWATLLIMQVAAFAVSLTVMRAMAFAHLLALPGNAALLAGLIAAAQRLTFMPLRVLLTAATVIATPFGAASATATALDSGAKAPATGPNADIGARCTTYATLRGIDAIPAALIFTPIDVGAQLLVYTHHSVVGTGHHRNVAGMKAVLEGLTATPDAARAIVTRTGAQYLAFCPGQNEINHYRKRYPRSLIAGLMAGKHPDWLEPVPMLPGEPVRVYRIVASIG